MTTRFPRSTSSLRVRFDVTYAVPQPSLTMSMCSPAVSSRSSHARGPRPLSRTCVRPPSRVRARSSSQPGIELLQLLLRTLLHVAVERVAVRVDADCQRAEVLHAELPEALRHELLPRHLLDLLDLRRLERGRAADDREVDHPELAHRLDRLVGEAALAADRADAVAAPERLREPHHARARRRADAALLVPTFEPTQEVRLGVEQEGAVEDHGRLLAVVEDVDLRAGADAVDVALDDHLVAGVELQDLLRVRDRERDLVGCHGAGAPRTRGRSRRRRRRRCAPTPASPPSTGS